MKTFLCLAVISLVGSFVFAGDPPAAGKNPAKVLLIGDSISIGYTPVVQKLLHDVATVSHPNDNCQFTEYGLKKLKEWLGTNKWDVIHFNFGIWDTHLMENGAMLAAEPTPNTHTNAQLRSTPAEYGERLTKIVELLEGTGAKLIWASTTPVLTRQGKRLEDIPNLNVVAAKIMKDHKIPVNDLYGFVLPHAKEWQMSDRCHFLPAGDEQLGQKVAQSIRQELNAPKSK